MKRYLCRNQCHRHWNTCPDIPDKHHPGNIDHLHSEKISI